MSSIRDAMIAYLIFNILLAHAFFPDVIGYRAAKIVKAYQMEMRR